MTHEDDQYGYGLPDVLTAMRRDFEEARRRLDEGDHEPLMLLAGAEVEIEFTIERQTQGGGGVNLKVFGVGFEAQAEKARNEGTAHRMKIVLSPVNDTGLLGGRG